LVSFGVICSARTMTSVEPRKFEPRERQSRELELRWFGR
jgi:hypothetical protein